MGQLLQVEGSADSPSRVVEIEEGEVEVEEGEVEVGGQGPLNEATWLDNLLIEEVTIV